MRPLACVKTTENDYVNLFGPQKNLYFFSDIATKYSLHTLKGAWYI